MSPLILNVCRDCQFLHAFMWSMLTRVLKLSRLFFLIIFPQSTSPLQLMSPHFLRMKRLYCKKKKKSTFESLSALCYDNFIVDSLREMDNPSPSVCTPSVQTAPYRVLLHWIQVAALTDHITCCVYWNNTDLIVCAYIVNSDTELMVRWHIYSSPSSVQTRYRT